MNHEELELWKESVFEHTRMMETLVNDRVAIKVLISNHLKQFFEYDEIKFDDLFNKIILKWDYRNNPVINPDDLIGLGMEFIISHDYSETLGHGVIIELYPFGLPKVEEDLIPPHFFCYDTMSIDSNKQSSIITSLRSMVLKSIQGKVLILFDGGGLGI